jgi:uncharacterized protein
LSESSPIDLLGALTIGSVDFVSPNEIKVLLELDAPQTTAINNGVPTPFPRINGYVLIPNETGAVIGQISWLGVEHSAFPKRTGMKDFGLVDLPFPLRKMSITPVGTLTTTGRKPDGRAKYELERGVFVFPSIGDPVLLPTVPQLRAIVEADETDCRIQIGVAPFAANAPVCVEPDRLFGRHLAILGNTGSGKSCTLAGLIRWSLKKAASVRKKEKRDELPNARFIILDPNGEYGSTFDDLGARHFRVAPVESPTNPLAVPAWMWNSHEWSVFAAAAPGVQRPILLQSLRDLRAGASLVEPVNAKVKRVFKSYKARLEQMIAQGISGYSGFPSNTACGNLLTNVATDATRYASQTEGDVATALTNVKTQAEAVANTRLWRTASKTGFNDFSETEIVAIVEALSGLLEVVPEESSLDGMSEDAPIQFDVSQIADHLEQLAGDIGVPQATGFIANLSMRIRMMLADRRLGPVVAPEEPPSFQEWLEQYIGSDGVTDSNIAVIDLSLVPADVVHIVVSVVARIIFEAIQRFRKLHGSELPTVLVLEEAHTFIQRGHPDEQSAITAATMCRQTFERIAREGRKFGLGLVLSSQRPSELSPTALAQCNTFILHRIVNDRDQELVARLVPDNLGGLLRELPSLPARQAIVLGWAVSVPILVEIRKLDREHCPASSDPEFWKVWTGEREAPVDWTDVVGDWTS